MRAPPLASLLLALSLSSALPNGMAGERPIRTELDTHSGMRFVEIPKGCFQMGSAKALYPKSDIRWQQLGFGGQLAADETPRHEVCLDAFWIGQHEVSAEQWERISGSPPPQGSGRQPAAGMSWAAARHYAQTLSALSGGAYRYRLPTEAEWEYACRAGNDQDIVPDRKQAVATAWYNHWSGEQGYPALEVADTGSLPANAWGVHDMLGNVWEWTEDSYGAKAYARHALFNPRHEGGTLSRVIRGGSYRSEYNQIRCSNRSQLDQASSLPHLGLRLVRVAGQGK